MAVMAVIGAMSLSGLDMAVVTAAGIWMMAGGREMMAGATGMTRTVPMGAPPAAATIVRTPAQPAMAGAGLKELVGPVVAAPGIRAAGAVVALAVGIVLAAPAAGFLATIETPRFTPRNYP
jgi:hypothetical protein